MRVWLSAFLPVCVCVCMHAGSRADAPCDERSDRSTALCSLAYGRIGRNHRSTSGSITVSSRKYGGNSSSTVMSGPHVGGFLNTLGTLGALTRFGPPPFPGPPNATSFLGPATSLGIVVLPLLVESAVLANGFHAASCGRSRKPASELTDREGCRLLALP